MLHQPGEMRYDYFNKKNSASESVSWTKYHKASRDYSPASYSVSCSPIWGSAAKFGDHEDAGSSEKGS